MLMIRLQRTGRENTPTYRIVVAEKTSPAKGKFLEIVGHYLPARNPVVLEKNDDRILHWVSKGAVPSDTVARILQKNGMKGLEKFVKRYTKKRQKGETPAATAPAAVSPAPEAKAPASEEKAPASEKSDSEAKAS